MSKNFFSAIFELTIAKKDQKQQPISYFHISNKIPKKKIIFQFKNTKTLYYL